MTNLRLGKQSGALHLMAIFIALLLGGVLYMIASFSSDLHQLRTRVDMLNDRIDRMQGQTPTN